MKSLAMSATFVCLLTLTLLPVMAKEVVLYHDNFAAVDTAGWTLQPPIDAIGPIKPNGTWAVENGALVATGTTKPWTVQTGGDPAWTNYKLAVKVTIRKPAPKSTFPIASCEYDRYLPREDYGEKVQHTGQYRYRYFAGEFDWGSEAAVYVRYQDRNNCYRVQLSSEYQEMILWNGMGGYLQVVPCKLEVGKTYRLDVLAQGAHLQVLLDGKKTIDYWHTCLPSLRGGIGLAAFNSTVAFQDVTITALPGPVTGMPEHQERFATRVWRTLTWVFDGNEPIVLLEPDPSPGSDYARHPMLYHFVKLRPGYRPAYFVPVTVLLNNAHSTGLVGGMETVAFTGQNTDRLTIDFDSITTDKSASAHHTDVLTFDHVRGTYRHTFALDVKYLVAQRVSNFEFADPFTYNNKEPARGVKYPWLPDGHKWGVFIGEDGKYYRHPISQSLNMDNQNSWLMRAGDTFWLLYPDRAVCPAWEHKTTGEVTYNGVCHWGYDWHQTFFWGEKPRDVKANDHFIVNYVMTGYPPAEAEQYFLKSSLAEKNNTAEPTDKNYNFMKVPSAYAFPVCDPSGTTFDKLYDVREPYVGWQFYGDYDNDRQVGHTDHYSMRLDGPADVRGMFYHHMIDGYAKRYLCTVWLKTKNVKGSVIVKLKYSGPPTPCDTIDTGLTGDNDWQELSFVTTIPCMLPDRYDSTDFIVEVRGIGSVWIDDFSVRPIEEGETVIEHRPTPKPLPALTPATDQLMYLPCNEGEGAYCADASNHGNNLKLKGATWAKTDRRAVLHFEDGASAYVSFPSPELSLQNDGKYAGAAFSIDAWIRPMAGKDGGDIIDMWYSPRIYLTAADPEKKTFKVNAQVVAEGEWSFLTAAAPIAANQWCHLALTVALDHKATLYINGTPVAEKVLKGKIAYTTYFGNKISVGTYGLNINSFFSGDMAELRWWNRGLLPGEVAAFAAAKQP